MAAVFFIQGLQCVYPEDKPVGHVVVTALDLKTLEETEFVNDTIIDYYYKVVQARYTKWKDTGETRAALHFFNSFFFKKLTEKGSHTRGLVRPFSLSSCLSVMFAR